MATTVKRRIRTRKKSNTQVRDKKRDADYRFAGGSTKAIGVTSDVNDLIDPERITKGVFGFFQDVDPNVIEADVRDNPIATAVRPIYPYASLLKVFLASTMLRQCVDSYVTNIEGYGVELEFVGPDGEIDSRAAQNEKARLKRLLSSLSGDTRSLREHREHSRIDKEVLGARCFEITRDMLGRVVGFDHVPTISVCMTKRDKEYTEFEYTDPVTGATKIKKRRFRRFYQMDSSGTKTWFKELYDPRIISPITGKVDTSLSIEDEASEMYFEALYIPGNPLGMPRWAGAIPALMGSREAENVNLNFFRDNAIPAMAVLVSGGALTQESFDKIEDYLTGIRGQNSMNRIVVMEAVAEGAEAAAIDGSLPAPRVDLKTMLSERQHDGLFKDYIADGERKARTSFRLPPIYVGDASEYNRASAFASVLTADQQIFVPERLAWDLMFEKVVLSSHGFRFWRVRSTGPGIQDPQEVARIVNSLGREGALTPNVAIKIANRYLDADIQSITDDWGNLPFASIMQSIKSGHTIEGLDHVISQLSSVTTGDYENEPGQVSQVLKNVIDDAMGELSDRLDDALQSIAAE